MKLIDPEKLKEKRTYLWDEALGTCACVLVEDIESAPAIDAMPVIRCANCKHYSRKYCTVDGDSENMREKDDFCSLAERREEDGNS